ncbi:MAG: UvrD-helicase domain-containing protein [Ignavibacteriae bacterium]|nr:UvrD-helicase domain-containing protein [Ignavibacteriota bacterium]
MNQNKLIVAAAGAGKTTFLVNEALKIKDERVLITTYTQANEAEIRKKIIEVNQCIPPNIIVQTWFSFLLQHGVRPFQGGIFEKQITGLILVNSQSGLKGYTKFKQPIYFGEEKEFERHYFSKEIKIYSDKISKFVFRCNVKSGGAVIERLCNIYSHIFIDEVQDLAGYDLELLKLFFKANSNTLLVGDPRQGTYSTNSSAKNKKFKKAAIINFFEDDALGIESDTTSLTTNYRCNEAICNLSNKLFTDLPPTTSGNTDTTTHDGVFLVRPVDVNEYLKTYSPVQLRENIKTEVNQNYRVMNFGESKGLSFDRVLIYPTNPILKWFADNNSELAVTSRSKLYVALTRARYSVGIICDYPDTINIDGISKWK